jgi:DNA-binding transcriptional ArsR family regulator
MKELNRDIINTLTVEFMDELEISTAPAMENFSSLNVDLHNLKKAAMVLRAINHKLRQQVLKLIDENGKMTVTEIYVKLRLEQSVASQHLAILRKAGFVKTERDGKFIYYSVSSERLEELNKFVKDLVG